MLNDIGSEFWEKGRAITENSAGNLAILLSGRTALDFIIRDIRSERRLNSISLPSYCCDSMIEPFVRNGVEVKVYRVFENRIDFTDNKCDAILLIDYFGYEDHNNIIIAEEARKNGKLVIYDSTHKLNGMSFYADYVFCSYRKWFYCNFAKVEKKSGEFNIELPKKTNEKYCQKRKMATMLKADFMINAKGNKQDYLSMLKVAENILDEDYENYSGIEVDFDEILISEIRRNNAQMLIDGLRDIPEINLWRPSIKNNDTPLFVPILVSNDQRDELRDYLIANSVYCPIHWPYTELHESVHCNEEIYKTELSLICDQRYGAKAMEKEISTIKHFFKR